MTENKNTGGEKIREPLKPDRGRRRRLYITAFVHSLLLLTATLWLLEMNTTYGDEKFLMQWSSVIKKMLFKIDNKPSKSELLFVNTSYDNMLIDKLDDDGFIIGNQAIVDREKLTRLFEISGRYPDKERYILCDIYFKDPSPFDAGLNRAMMNAGKIIIPFHTADSGTAEMPLPGVNRGLVDYNIIGGSFLKYSLIQGDSIPGLPLKMYQDISGADFKRKVLLSSMNGKLSFNTVIIDFKVRPFDIIEGKSPDPYPFVNLGEFLSLPDTVIAETMKNRIVLIGDLRERDMHQTYIGSMPGIMILLNIYLMLKNSENIIHPLFLLILFVSYFLISVDVFSVKNISDRKFVKKIAVTRTGKFFVKFLGYVFYLSAVSVLIYMFYDIHINILLIAIYLKFTDSVLMKLRGGKEKEYSGGWRKTLYNFKNYFLKLIGS
ncbi:MAG: CHASE2 domain-containing protein [Ignavibacteriae bacterium]|nr:CHASE2 domain-containing protein [Ignavibacteriota bacterium]